MKVFGTYTALTLWRVALLYIVTMLCRAVFVVYNIESFDIAYGEIAGLIAGGLQFDTASIIYADGIWLALSLLPLRLRERKWYREILYWYYVVVNSLAIVAVNLGDAVYFRYTQKRFTAEEIFFADNSNSASLVLKFAAENWYLVLAGALLIAILAFGYRRNAKITRTQNLAVYYAANSAILVVATVLCVGGTRGGFSRMTRPIAIPNAMQYAADWTKANIVLSNPFCILRTAGSGGGNGRTEFFSAKEVAEIYTPYHFPPRGGEFSDRNIVIFVMESMSAEHSAYLCGDIYADEEVKGYTPFLDSLMNESFVFTRMYANGKRSIQALPSIWSSIPSLRKPFMLMAESLGKSRPLPRILRESGYSTAFFCGSERGSMGFGAYANAAGIERQFSLEDYEKRHGKDDFDGYWGIWDEPFMSYMGEELDSLPEPFFASMFTISSHHPFVVPDDRRADLPEGKTKIHRCVAYTDGAFRRFFAENRGKEWFDRTIFVFVADHVSSEKFAPRTRTSPHDLHIIGFIYTPDGSLRGRYGQPVSQIDIMPTLLGMTGYDTPYFAFGRDVLNEPCDTPAAIVFDGDYKAITDRYVYSFDGSGIKSIYAIDDTERHENFYGKIPSDDIERRIKAMIQQYYDHAKRKTYIIDDDTVRQDNGCR